MNPMLRPPRRPLTLADGMILIAASGIGLAVFQLILRTILGGNYRLENLATAPPGGWTTGQVIVRAVQWIGPTLPFVASWTCTLPILRMRPPRPSVRRCLRQPGMVACLAALIGLGWAAIGLAETLTVDRLTSDALAPTPLRWLFHFLLEELFAYVGLAVAASWIVLALAGRWRPAVDWIDRFGRVLGGFWIFTGLVWACRRYLEIVVF